eukprot:scaffold2325_cov374-Prasinococcus_capsulatus_cf.AAC.2
MWMIGADVGSPPARAPSRRVASGRGGHRSLSELLTPYPGCFPPALRRPPPRAPALHRVACDVTSCTHAMRCEARACGRGRTDRQRARRRAARVRGEGRPGVMVNRGAARAPASSPHSSGPFA